MDSPFYPKRLIYASEGNRTTVLDLLWAPFVAAGWEVLAKNKCRLSAFIPRNSSPVLRFLMPGLVHHSDRGTQYASNDYVRQLEDAGIVISMSRPARPWENAYCESFMFAKQTPTGRPETMSTLKREHKLIDSTRKQNIHPHTALRNHTQGK